MPIKMISGKAKEREASNLGWHGFADSKSAMSRETLLRKLSSLPEDNQTIDLSANQLGSCDNQFLEKILQSFPQNITSLDLSLNQFHKMELSDLTNFLSQLPISLTHLNLSRNTLDAYSQENLVRILTVLPPNIISVDMSYNLPDPPESLENIKDELARQGKAELDIIDSQALSSPKPG